MNDTSIKKRPLKKYLTVLLGIVIISVFVANVLVIATAGILTPKPASVTILYDPTDTVLATTAINIQNYIGEFTAVHLVPVAQAKNLLTLIARISNPIVYVFHGNTAGWKVGNDFVTNTILSAAIEKSPSTAHFFVACNSDVLALMISNKYIGSLLGITDAQVGTLMIEEQLLSYFSTRGLTQDQYTQLDTNLQTYIKDNGMAILSRMIHPVQPLRLPTECSGSDTEYDSSYAGPSGFYVTSNSITGTYNQAQLQGTPLSGQVTAAVNILNNIQSIPGVKFTITGASHSVTGNAVYSYDTVSCPPGSGVYIITWYSIVNYAAFNYYSFSVSGSINVQIPTSPTTVTLSTTSTTSSPSGPSLLEYGITFHAPTLVSGYDVYVSTTPSVEPSSKIGGSLGYATGVTYTQAPPNSNCLSITTQWINSNVQPNTWQTGLYAEIDITYAVNINVVIAGYTFPFNVANFLVGDKFVISADANNNLLVKQVQESNVAEYLQFSSTLNLVLASASVQLLIVPVALVAQDGGMAMYSGIYFKISASILGIGSSLTFTYTTPFSNSIPGTSTNTLISNLAGIIFG